MAKNQNDLEQFGFIPEEDQQSDFGRGTDLSEFGFIPEEVPQDNRSLIQGGSPFAREQLPDETKNYIANQLMFRPGEDILAGIGSDIQGASKLASPLVSTLSPALGKYLSDISERDIHKRLGVPGVSKNILDVLTEKSAAYAPFAALGPEGYTGEALRNALFGAIQDPEHPLTGAAVGAGVGVGTKGLMDIAPIVGSKVGGAVQRMAQKRLAEKVAPSYLDSLIDESGNPQNLNKVSSDEVLKAFRKDKKQDRINFKPLNDQSIRLDELSKKSGIPFSGYASTARDLLANKENMANLFGAHAPDMTAKLSGEMSKASNFMDKSQEAGVTLPEAIKRIKTLGRLGRSVEDSGNRDDARLLYAMHHGLKNDVLNILKGSGRGDLADRLMMANEFHKNNIVPFYRTREIRKIIGSQGEHESVGDTLAKELFHPGNARILNKIPQNIKNAQISRLITGGRGTAEGYSNLDAKQIASNWNRLKTEQKSQVKMNNPVAAQFFDALSDSLAAPKGLKEAAIEIGESPIVAALRKTGFAQPAGMTREMGEKLLAPKAKDVAHMSRMQKIKEISKALTGG